MLTGDLGYHAMKILPCKTCNYEPNFHRFNFFVGIVVLLDSRDQLHWQILLIKLTMSERVTQQKYGYSITFQKVSADMYQLNYLELHHEYEYEYENLFIHGFIHNEH